MVEHAPEPNDILIVATEDEFHAAVREGLADIAAGRTIDIETVEAELRQIIDGQT